MPGIEQPAHLFFIGAKGNQGLAALRHRWNWDFVIIGISAGNGLIEAIDGLFERLGTIVTGGQRLGQIAKRNGKTTTLMIQVSFAGKANLVSCRVIGSVLSYPTHLNSLNVFLPYAELAAHGGQQAFGIFLRRSGIVAFLSPK